MTRTTRRTIALALRPLMLAATIALPAITIYALYAAALHG